jgi:phosphate/phosphite/phosphonate ABC transporter binding protein
MEWVAPNRNPVALMRHLKRLQPLQSPEISTHCFFHGTDCAMLLGDGWVCRRAWGQALQHCASRRLALRSRFCDNGVLDRPWPARRLRRGEGSGRRPIPLYDKVKCELRSESRVMNAEETPMLKIGAVAYQPYVVTIFEGIKKHFSRVGVPLDWVLYSNYDALVEAFVRKEVDLAWNGPLAYVKIRRRLPDGSRVVAMRDMDVDFTTQFITHPDAAIQTLQDLQGKRFAFASRGSVQAGLLAYHFLKQAGIHPEKDLAQATFAEERPSGGPVGEAGVIALVRSREYDAGAVSRHALATLREKGQLHEGEVRVFWSSPGYSHCCFTAHRELDEALAQRITAAFTAMRGDDPEHRQVLELEGCKAFVPGTAEGYDILEAAAEDQGLV